MAAPTTDYATWATATFNLRASVPPYLLSARSAGKERSAISFLRSSMNVFAEFGARRGSVALDGDLNALGPSVAPSVDAYATAAYSAGVVDWATQAIQLYTEAFTDLAASRSKGLGLEGENRSGRAKIAGLLEQVLQLNEALAALRVQKREEADAGLRLELHRTHAALLDKTAPELLAGQQRLKNENVEQGSQIRLLHARVAELEGENREAAANIANLEASMEWLDERVDQLQADVKEKEEKLWVKDSALIEMQAQLKNTQDELERAELELFKLESRMRRNPDGTFVLVQMKRDISV